MRAEKDFRMFALLSRFRDDKELDYIRYTFLSGIALFMMLIYLIWVVDYDIDVAVAGTGFILMSLTF